MLTKNDLFYRLGELREIEDGWLGGKGRAPTEEAFRALYIALDEFLPKDQIPYIYPTEEGGFSIEWEEDLEDFFIHSNGNHSFECEC